MVPNSVLLSPTAPVTRVAEIAQLAERLGFHRVFIADEGLSIRDTFVTMTTVALATESIKIGTGITNPYSRHPAITAGMAATIDELSGGRVFLGYGAGGTTTLRPLGLDRSRPLVHVREAVEASRRLFSGVPVTFEGETLTLRDASIDFARPDIELWVAGRGRRILRQAGEMADGVLLQVLHKPSLGEYMDHVRDGMRRSGNDPTLVYSTMVTTDRDRIADMRRHMTYRLLDSPPSVLQSLGVTEDDTKAIGAALVRGLDAAAPLIPEEWVEPFVIVGNRDECAAEIKQLVARHGFDEFMVVVSDLDEAGPLLEELAPALGGPR